MNPRTPSKSAFTLVELLVVIAIICILAALLLPVLSRAKERTRRVACLNNVRNLNILFISYARDNNDRLPRYVNWMGPQAIFPPLDDYLNLYKTKADAFYDPGMRSWARYDQVVQMHFYTNGIQYRAARQAQGIPVRIGYVLAFYLQPGFENANPDFNWTIAPQPVQLGVVLLPATNASERVLTAGILVGGSNAWCNGFGDVWNIKNGIVPWAPVNHRNGSNPQIAAGENYGMLDGSAKWRKPKEMRPRKYTVTYPDGLSGTGSYWW